MRATTLVCWFLLAGAAPAGETVDYVRDIKPILSRRCYACHGALRQKAGLRVDTAALLQKGGKHGPALTPGRSAESLVVAAVTGTDRPRMPPENEGEPLSRREIELLRAWIDQGAKAPSEPTPEDPRQHWAFRPPVRPAIPPLAESRNPIDAFLAVEHHRSRIQPGPEAARETLLRRVYLDLVGLPPTREELHAFLADASPAAYEKVVDRLLASPQHGERWARHWMDIWRYSDWYGRRAVPDVWNSAPQIWRWRDWIVRSLNTDKGYDCMVREMLAADEQAPTDDESVVATGYLVRSWYALNPNQWMRELVEHTGKAFLGLTLNCAHCHDHKYDPISQEEYFRFRAFFEPLDLRQDRVPGEPDPGPFQKYEYTKLRKPVKSGLVRVLDEHPEARTYLYALGDERDRIPGRPPVTPGAPAFLGGDRLAITPVSLPPVAYYPGLKSFIRQEETARAAQTVAEAHATLTRAQQSVAQAQGQAAVLDAVAALQLATARVATAETERLALAARIAADQARYQQGPGDSKQLAQAASQLERQAALAIAQEKLLQAEQALAASRSKGDTKALPKAEQRVTDARKGVETARQALAAPAGTYTPLSPVYPATSTGRRLALAHWITHRDNPLTARVAVNHIWTRHFGKPLVETVFDFGRNGKRPTHPELLDWLAVELMDSGWSLKHLHRLIVTSDAYRRTSAATAAGRSLDPENRTLWHFPRRRAEAEVVRDSLLHAAGDLDARLGGPELETSEEPASRRRSLYFSVHPEGGHLKLLEPFDAPDPCECYRRSESLVPQQALALTNSDLVHRQGRVLARKLSADHADARAFLVAAFEQVLTRRPTEDEQRLCLEFLEKQAALHRGTDGDAGARARESLIRALFNHEEFIALR